MAKLFQGKDGFDQRFSLYRIEVGDVLKAEMSDIGDKLDEICVEVQSTRGGVGRRSDPENLDVLNSVMEEVSLQALVCVDGRCAGDVSEFGKERSGKRGRR